jgi:tetratricopeptide (TPR) repeat protein
LGVAIVLALPVSVMAATALTLKLPGLGLVVELDPLETSPAAAEVLRLYEAGQPQAAAFALDTLLRHNPSDPTAIVIRGYGLVRANPQAALDAAATVLVEQGPRKDALDLMGMAFAIYRSRAPSDKIDADIRVVEIRNNAKLLLIYPDWGELLFRTASQRIALERLRPSAYDQLTIAVGELSHLIVVLNQNAAPARIRGQAQFQVARAYKHLEDSQPTPGRETGPLPENYRRALEHFAKTMKIDPSRLDAMGEIVLLYQGADRPEKALAAVRGAFDQFTDPPFLAKLHEMEGRLLLDLGQQHEAAAAFEKAIDLDDTRDASWLTLARMLAQSGNIAAAVQLLDRAANIRPKTLEIHQARAKLVEVTAPDAAIASWRILLSVKPSDAVTLGMRPSPERFRTNLYMTAALELARLYIALEDWDQAIAALRLARRNGATEAQIARLSQGIVGR